MIDDTDRKGQLSKLAHSLMDWLDDAGYHRTCLTCESWIEGPTDNRQQLCGKYKMRPPTKIIISGCPDHTDLIPY
jgi:hypothetical protein